MWLNRGIMGVRLGRLPRSTLGGVVRFGDSFKEELLTLHLYDYILLQVYPSHFLAHFSFICWLFIFTIS